MRRLLLGALLTIGSLGTPASAGEIQLMFTSPQPRSHYFPEHESIQYRSGWKLELLLRARERQLQGIAAVSGLGIQPPFPENGLPSALIFRDDDDCPWLGGDSQFCPLRFDATCPCAEDPTERYVFFVPDIDHPRMPGDGEGVGELRAELADMDNWPAFGGPRLPRECVEFSEEFPDFCTVYGDPDVTGIGYGPNDDLPSLVLMSNVGVGIVYEHLITNCYTDPEGGQDICDPDYLFPRVVSWERAIPAARYNLAGLMNSVQFELRSQWGYSEISTSMQVPRHLFTNFIMADPCFEGQGSCDEIGLGNLLPVDGVVRIDAGPIIDGENVPQSVRVELRAVLVNGRAPGVIEDCTGEGEVTAADLACAGYVLLSEEAVVEFDTFRPLVDHCSSHADTWASGDRGWQGLRLQGLIDGRGVVRGGNFAYVSFDDHLLPGGGIVCPLGSGGTSRPPR